MTRPLVGELRDYLELGSLKLEEKSTLLMEAAAFVDRIVARLMGSGSPLLSTVARSDRHWRNEIANGMARSQTEGKRISNAVAECLNNMIKSLKKISHGLYSFERFRKRALLIFTYFRKFGTQVLR